MNLGLIGEKLSYSRSVEIHKYFFDLMAIKGKYLNYELSKDQLKDFIENCNLDGFNVTIPYKNTIINHLDYVDDEAMMLASVNTVVCMDGKLYGYNTDIKGFDLMLKYFDIEFKNKSIIILGTGASANMIKYYANKVGCKSVKLVGTDDGDYNYSDKFSGQILVNTTPVGVANSNDEAVVIEEVVKCFETIIDINYNPYRTKLLRYGIYNNLRVVNGLYMLVAQAIIAQQYFQDKNIDLNIIDTIYNTLLETRNIVFIGMSGCGKTTIGKQLANKLGMKFIDSDEEIERVTNSTISDLFDISKSHFRNIESEVINDISTKTSHVISCGGGVVLNEENMRVLGRNSVIIYLERTIDNLAKTLDLKNRPLLKNNPIKTLETMYEDRHSLYIKYCEYTVDNNQTVDDTVSTIINILK